MPDKLKRAMLEPEEVPVMWALNLDIELRKLNRKKRKRRIREIDAALERLLGAQGHPERDPEGHRRMTEFARRNHHWWQSIKNSLGR